jgi:hypothetical protein
MTAPLPRPYWRDMTAAEVAALDAVAVVAILPLAASGVAMCHSEAALRSGQSPVLAEGVEEHGCEDDRGVIPLF